MPKHSDVDPDPTACQVVEAEGRSFAPVVTHVNILLPPEGPAGDKRPVQVSDFTLFPSDFKYFRDRFTEQESSAVLRTASRRESSLSKQRECSENSILWKPEDD